MRAVDSGQWTVNSEQWALLTCQLPCSLLTVHCPHHCSLSTAHCPLFLSTKQEANRVALRIGCNYVDFSVPVHVADGEMPCAFARQRR